MGGKLKEAGEGNLLPAPPCCVPGPGHHTPSTNLHTSTCQAQSITSPALIFIPALEVGTDSQAGILASPLSGCVLWSPYLPSLTLSLLIIQLGSVARSYPTPCDPMDCSTPGLPVHHQLPKPTQTHVHCVGDAIQQLHPLLSPSPLAFNLSQHQGLFK